MSAYLIHSAKGSTWKKHKYIRIVDGRYIYPKKQIEEMSKDAGGIKFQQATKEQREKYPGGTFKLHQTKTVGTLEENKKQSSNFGGTENMPPKTNSKAGTLQYTLPNKKKTKMPKVTSTTVKQAKKVIKATKSINTAKEKVTKIVNASKKPTVKTQGAKAGGNKKYYSVGKYIYYNDWQPSTYRLKKKKKKR